MGNALVGVKVPHRKHTASVNAKTISAVSEVIMPMQMHIGAPATPCVKVGDKVLIGDKIGEQNGFVSSAVFASVSGTVKKISEIELSNGKSTQAVLIESDGEMKKSEGISVPQINSREDLIEAMKNCGLVGLGGAGFPTYVKFSAEEENFEDLILNGAECEPYITSDSYTMENLSEDIYLAISKILEFFPFKRVIIGIENNKPEAIKKMKEIANRNEKISVKVLSSLYPQGGEKVLVYHTTGKIAGEGKLPIHVKCVVCNVTTMQKLGEFLRTGMPLVSKCVTVDGACVAEPLNIIAPIGTPIKNLFEECGSFRDEPYKVVYGGPMMGITVPSLELPIMKNTNAVLALSEKETRSKKTTACIRCGACVNHCPFGINPPAIATAFRKGEFDEAVKNGVNLCMECGCCSYICPARRPIVQNHRLIKAALKNQKGGNK